MLNEQQQQLKLDKEYLKRELLDVEYTITNDKIYVRDDVTIYANITRYTNFIDKKELLSKRQQIVKLAKQHGISISYKNKSKKIIEDIYDNYVKDYHKSQQLFDELIDMWKHVRDNRGIHMGTTDDYYLDLIHKKTWELQELFYRKNNISILETINKNINNMLEQIKSEDNMYMIDCVYL